MGSQSLDILQSSSRRKYSQIGFKVALCQFPIKNMNFRIAFVVVSCLLAVPFARGFGEDGALMQCDIILSKVIQDGDSKCVDQVENGVNSIPKDLFDLYTYGEKI